MHERLPSKEIFIIHSKSREEEAQIATLCAQLLFGAGYSIYEYSDWSWEAIREKQSYSWDEGGWFDHERYIMGEPPLVREEHYEEIAEETLDQIFGGVRIAIFINPARDRPTEGVLEEIYSLLRTTSSRKSQKQPPIRLIYCYLGQDTEFTTGGKLRFDDHIDIPLSLDKDISEQPHVVECIFGLVALTVRHLVEQRVEFMNDEYIRKKIYPDNQWGGNIMLWKLWGSEKLKEEIERATLVLEMIDTKYPNALHCRHLRAEREKLKRALASIDFR